MHGSNYCDCNQQKKNEANGVIETDVNVDENE